MVLRPWTEPESQHAHIRRAEALQDTAMTIAHRADGCQRVLRQTVHHATIERVRY